MEQKAGKFNDEYRYLDPKILRGGDSIPRLVAGKGKKRKTYKGKKVKK